MAPHTPAGDERYRCTLARLPSAAELAGPSPEAIASSDSSSGSSRSTGSGGDGGRFAYITLLTRRGLPFALNDCSLGPAACNCRPPAARRLPKSHPLSLFPPLPLPPALCRDSYLPGVQALARSLAAVHAAHPLLIMYTADTLSPGAMAALEREAGCQPLAVQRYHPPGGLPNAAWQPVVVRHRAGGTVVLAGMLPGIAAQPAWRGTDPTARCAAAAAPLPLPPLPAGNHNAGRYKLQLYAECWTKLRMWELEQYDRWGPCGCYDWRGTLLLSGLKS